jgi:Na+/melibiose symporter-like transporter
MPAQARGRLGDLRHAAGSSSSGRLIWILGVGALGLAWPTATAAAFLPTVLAGFTSSSALIGLVLASEGVFALLLPTVVGALSDATATPLGRRRPYLFFATPPLAIAVALLASMPSLGATAVLLWIFFFANYVYEPPWRSLYADLLPPEVSGRAQGAAHVLRGVAMAGALVGGGLALSVWLPLPFVIAGIAAGLACAYVPLRVRERPPQRIPGDRIRTHLLAPWRLVRRDRTLRRFMIANTAWETTFAGMRTFVVLYIVEGLGQSLYVSAAVLAMVTTGYILAAAVVGPFADRLGLGKVILWASVVYGIGLVAAGLATSWHTWHYAFVAVVALAGGTVMTLAWGLLFKLMPPTDRGAISGLAVTTRGIGLLVGPPLVGLAVDLLEPTLSSTKGYAAVWPVVAIPILAVIPLVVSLARTEERLPRLRTP